VLMLGTRPIQSILPRQRFNQRIRRLVFMKMEILKVKFDATSKFYIF